MNIEQGDLFLLSKEYALGHCISLDCKGGRGIVVDFYNRYQEMREYTKEEIKKKNLTVPCVVPYKGSDGVITFNLITKSSYSSKPTYTTISKCIQQMAIFCREWKIPKLALPLIGCGLDRLEWSSVKVLIVEEFKDIEIDIEIRYL